MRETLRPDRPRLVYCIMAPLEKAGPSPLPSPAGRGGRRAPSGLDQDGDLVGARVDEVEADAAMDAAIGKLRDDGRDDAGGQIPARGEHDGVVKTAEGPVEDELLTFQSVALLVGVCLGDAQADGATLLHGGKTDHDDLRVGLNRLADVELRARDLLAAQRLGPELLAGVEDLR